MTASERASGAVEAEAAHERVRGLNDVVTVAGDRDVFPVTEAYTGDVIGEAPLCTADDVAAAAERASDAQERWADRPIAERKEILLDYHDLVLDHQAELLDVAQLESGKARRHAHEELMDVALNARHYAHRAEDYLAPERRKPAIPGLTKSTEYHRPVGTVGVISPWNYPLTLAVSDALPAVLAGNAVVLKPARETTYTALLAVKLLREAGVPRDVFQVVTGKGSTLGSPLVDESDFICFTGSSETGRHVAAEAGRNLIKCSMELGGKNPAVILPDADLDKAVDGLLRGCFTNAGQLCISIERIYVHEDVREAFAERFARAARELELGATYDWEPECGSLISADQLETVEAHVEDATAKGATVLAGGEARPDLGPYFYEPTVLTDVTEEMDLYREETFGPVVSIYGFEAVDEAVALANDSQYGLNASVWTEDLDRGERIATRIECGTVNVNEGYAPAYAATDAPMGGMGDSGIGRRHGDEGILKYTESQNVTVQKRADMGTPPGVPYRLYAKGTNRLLKLIKNVPGLR